MSRILANQIAATITAFKRRRAIIARRVLFCADNGLISQLFDDLKFQMESLPRFPERDAIDLLEMREDNQNRNTERSTKNWVKVFDLWLAELR